ncbi:MAG: hypothetical protein ACI906_000968 [Candidatus Latescibacterota bacterium]|jgi:hypothetical protein
MRIYIFSLVLTICIAAPFSQAAIAAELHAVVSVAPIDSTAGPISYRSPLETALYAPGYLLYVPFHLFFSVSKLAASALWEQHALDRIKAHLTTADGRLGIRPLSSTDIGSGLRIFARDIAGSSHIGATSSWGTGQGRQHHALSLAWPHHRLAGGYARVYARFDREPKESFFGIGNDTRSASKSAFSDTQTQMGLEFNHRHGSMLHWNSGLGYRRVAIDAGRSSSAPSADLIYSDNRLLGWGQHADFAEAHINARAQFVDRPGSPTRGYRARAGLRYSHSLDKAKLSHWALQLNSEHFFELFYRRTLSLQLGSAWRWAPGANRIPFYELSPLGGSDFLRAERRGRFRDRGAAFAALHYRYPVWKMIDGHIFSETGRVFAQPQDFTLSGWHHNYGAGLRLWVPQGLIFEQLIAFGSESTKLYFNFKSDF